MNRKPVKVLHRHEPLDSAKPLTARQELYAQAISRGMSKAAAYREAGYKGPQATTRMKRYPNVQAKIAQLMAETAARSRLTVEQITEELLAIIERGKGGDSAQMLNTARAALMNLVAIHGLEAGKGGEICTCGGANRITEIRRVLVYPDGREEEYGK